MRKFKLNQRLLASLNQSSCLGSYFHTLEKYYPPFEYSDKKEITPEYFPQFATCTMKYYNSMYDLRPR